MKMFAKTIRSASAFLLVAALMLGVCSSPIALAQEPTAVPGTPVTGDGPYYVSLGDSMSNGYGLEDYNGNTGVFDYGNGSYAELFADDYFDASSNHAQLAMSAMRAEDLHWLLEVDYEDPAVVDVIETLAETEEQMPGDYYENNIGEFDALWYSVFDNGDFYTWNELVNDYRFDIAAAYIEFLDYPCVRDNTDMTEGEKEDIYDHYTDVEALQIVAECYQENVKAADVISLGIGNGNFGVFAFGRIMEAIGFDGAQPEDAMIYNIDNALRECDEETKALIYDLMEEVKAVLAERGIVADDGEATVSPMEALYNTAMYAVVSYALNYAGTVEAILQLNPDAEIIQVALMNTMESKETVADDITLGELMGYLFDSLNAYIAALPTAMQATQNSVYADATFYWAEADYVEVIADTYANDTDFNDIVRQRFYWSIVEDEEGEPGMVWKLLGDDVAYITFDEINEYKGWNDSERIAFAAVPENSAKASSIAIYLAFETAIRNANTPVTIDSVLGLGSILESDPFAPIMEEFEAEVKNAAAGKLDAVYSEIVESYYGLPLGTIANVKAKNEEGKEYLYQLVSAALYEEFEDLDLDAQPTPEQIEKAVESENPDDKDLIIKAYYETMEVALLKDFDEAIEQMKTQVPPDDPTVSLLCTLLVTPDVLGDTIANSSLSGLLALFARCIIGNGVGSHPSADGHKALYNAVKDAYDGKYTSADKTLDNLRDLFPDIFAFAEGFVPETEALVKELKAIILAKEDTVKELYANLEEMNAEVAKLLADLEVKLAELNEKEDKILAELVANREALVNELESLEAKLEAVVNGTYGRAAVSDKDALIADTKAAIAATKAAIAELDATIAYVVEQIKTDKSGIEAIKADIEVIKANIAATETALAEVVAAIDQLKADIVVLADATAVLYEVAVGQFVDLEDVVDAITAIVEVVPEIVDNVNELYELGVEVAEKVEAAVEVISGKADAISAAVEALYASAEDWANVNVEKAEAVAETLEAIKALLDKFVEVNYPVAEEAVNGTVDKLYKAIEAYVTWNVNKLTDIWEEYKDEVFMAAGIVYLYCEDKGYVAYVEELVCGYIEDACELLNDLKADLKDAKIELEAKRAELEAKLPEWKAELAELKAELLKEVDEKKAAIIEKAIEEIEAKIEAAEKVVAELEVFVAKVEAHIAEVEAALEAVEAALNVANGDIEALIDALKDLAVALKDLGCSVGALAETVVGEVEKLIGYGEMICEDIIAVIETLDVYCDLAERFAEVLKNELIENRLEVLEYLKEALAEVVDYLADAIVDAVEKYFPELADAIYDYLYNNPEEVIEFVKTYGPYLLALLEEYGDEALAFIGYVLYNYGDEIAEFVIENHEAILSAIVEWIDVHGENALALIQVYAEALGLCDAVREEIAELEALLEQLYAELENAVGEAKEAIEAKIEEVKAAIEELKAKLEAIEDVINDIIADVNGTVEEIIAEIEAAVEELKKAVEEVKEAVDELIANIKEDVDAAIAAIVEELEALLDKQIETLEDLVEALKEAALEAAKEIKAIVDELVYDATHGEYVIENDSFYVALGDSSAVSKSYVDALAAVLGVDYANLAQAGHTTTDTLALIAEQAELLAKADLVTIGYTANIFTAEVTYTLADILQGNPVEAYDWAALVTDDGVEYVEKALTEVRAMLAEQGMDVTVSGKNLADTLVAAVEAYAYRYVEHMLTYPVIVNAIHNVAPEALVVIVGLHNTVEDIVIDVEGTQIALGDYVQYAVDAANVVSLVNAILVEDTVFVNAPDVETLKEEKGDELTYDMISFVMEAIITNGADFATSANGHAYIAEQILNALTIVDARGLLGDADGDGDVDSTDAMYILQYDALLINKDQLNLVVCDVDGDGDVDSTDAMYILQYDGLLIEVFPVEE